jgi:hypothetical protein
MLFNLTRNNNADIRHNPEVIASIKQLLNPVTIEDDIVGNIT